MINTQYFDVPYDDLNQPYPDFGNDQPPIASDTLADPLLFQEEYEDFPPGDINDLPYNPAFDAPPDLFDPSLPYQGQYDDPQAGPFYDDPQAGPFYDNPQAEPFYDDPQAGPFYDDPNSLLFDYTKRYQEGYQDGAYGPLPYDPEYMDPVGSFLKKYSNLIVYSKKFQMIHL